MTQRFRGDRALAWGALAAGVRLVSGYPGSPATGVFEALAADWAEGRPNGSWGPNGSRGPNGSPVQAHWAPNEKVALEMVYGASLAGVRALAVMKGVGLNIALDPLATMALSGCHAGLVIAVGDDPGGWGSQNEQDSRHLARLAEVPLLAPTGVGQAAAAMCQAFAWSEAVGTPVIVHFCTSLALAELALRETKGEEVEDPHPLPDRQPGFWREPDRWVVLPANVVRYHRRLHHRLQRLRDLFEASPYDHEWGQGEHGVLAVGYMARKVQDLALLSAAPGAFALRVLGLSSLWPLPEGKLARWLSGLGRVLVLEEGSSFVEEALRALAQRRRLDVEILGRADGVLPSEGELGQVEVAAALRTLDPGLALATAPTLARAMPSRVPLCPDCPYLPTFESLLRVIERRGGRDKHIVVGETGCMVRAHLGLRLFDVKYSLGAGLGLGLGLALGDRTRRTVAILGDSSFFHTDLNALPHAAHLEPPLTVLILDNGTTALTGGQVHPGSALDERRQARTPVDLVAMVRACGVEPRLLGPESPDDLEAALGEALATEGLRVIIVRGPCPRYAATSAPNCSAVGGAV